MSDARPGSRDGEKDKRPKSYGRPRITTEALELLSFCLATPRRHVLRTSRRLKPGNQELKAKALARL